MHQDSINLAFRECSNQVDKVKFQQLLMPEEFKKLQAHFEKQVKAINFVRDGTH